ncbi:S6 family peptidase [Escherichia coli]
MNKIYSHRICHKTGIIKVVSELISHTRKSKSKKYDRTLFLIPVIFSLLSFPTGSKASVVNGNNAYQNYRDFAENKGAFQPGATDIPVYDTNGYVTGTLSISMPDFSSVATEGYATLISPQYIVSVKHNKGYNTVSFGDGQNSYTIVNRNEDPSRDFHTPRLNKLVTEVSPADAISTGDSSNFYTDSERYTAFVRLGSGRQFIKNEDGTLTQLAAGYSYLTGGTLKAPVVYQNGNSLKATTPDLFNSDMGLLPTTAQPGDSGSPLFAWDSWTGKWVLIGVQTAISSSWSYWAAIPVSDIQAIINDDSDGTISFLDSAGALIWTYNSTDGTGTISQGNTTYTMHGTKDGNLDAGKNLTFTGDDGLILLRDNVDQGAGTLTFNSNYTVSTDNNSTWMGGGLDIAEGTSVTWQVNGVSGDNLHKIGAGTLIVNASGINEGGLKVGDGTTVLDQQPDKDGNVQAFSSVNIASGRATVVLADSNQVDPDNISWGYKGGTLDLNGNNLTFHQIKAADYGAVIANTADSTSTVTLSYSLNSNDVNINNWAGLNSKGTPGDLYVYNNTYTNTTDYFILKTDGYYGYYPTNQSSSDIWEYVGHDQDAAQKLVADRYNSSGYLYHGQFTGNLNIVNTVASGATGSFVMDGSADISGSFTQENGRLTLQGHPVIHAYNSQSIADTVASTGDDSVLTQPTSFTQSDWENRSFTFGALNLKNTDFSLGRNATLNTVIQAENSVVTLGGARVYIDLKDGDGTDFELEEGESIATADADKSHFYGSVILDSNSTLTVNEVFNGNIQASDSSVTINSDEVLIGDVVLQNSAMTLNDGASAVVSDSLNTDGAVSVDNAFLQLGENGNTRTRSSAGVYRAAQINLSGEKAALYVTEGNTLYSDILSDSSASLIFGDSTQALSGTSDGTQVTRWEGSLNAEDASLTLYGTEWRVTSDSQSGTLSARNSLIDLSSYSDGSRRLSVSNFDSSDSTYRLNVGSGYNDQLVVTESATGQNNTLLLNFTSQPQTGDVKQTLVIAPDSTSSDLFHVSTISNGFSEFIPETTVDTTDGVKKWELESIQVQENKPVTQAAGYFLRSGYQQFLTEMNNLTIHMSDLRDNDAPTGVWARLINGSGSGKGDYSDRYTHFQMGADRKHELESMDLIHGIMLTYTDSRADGKQYTGKTRSYGAGIYASGIFPDGAYFDLTGKYVQHANDYTLSLAGAGQQTFHSHSLYAALQVGQRYRYGGNVWLEPQAELVYGRISGRNFSWSDNSIPLRMKSSDMTPLVGRIGIESGKDIDMKKWSARLRAGVSYQADLRDHATVLLQDSASTYKSTSGKDNRVLLNAGLQMNLGQDKRLDMGLEKSFMGDYNVDHAVKASFTWSF